MPAILIPRLDFGGANVGAASLGEAEAKKMIVGCAEQLGLAYNHQSRPRCFNFNTDVFPWQEFDPHDG
jgi:hypothetical protein